MTISLRPYQSDLIDRIRAGLKEFRHVLVLLSTGGGKTIIASFMALHAAMKGKRILFTCHRDFLLEQTAEAFKALGIEYTFIAAGLEYNPFCPVIIASIDTLKRRYMRIEKPDLVIVDEAIHAAATGWDKVISYFQEAGCFTIGLCACAERAGGQGLGKWFKAIIEGPSMEWLIENKYLSRYKVYAPSKPDLSGVHTIAGDYAKEEIAAVMNKPYITGNAINEYKKIADGKQAVVFCCNIEHSKDVCEAFKNAGYTAAHIGSDTNKIERKNLLAAFKRGEIKILTSVNIFSEGFDLPVVQYGALLRPTKSLNVYMQQIGRILRFHPDKEFAYIADHANNVEHFGMPDEKREWSLENRKKRESGERTDPVRTCPKCHYCERPKKVCSNCKYEFPIMERKIDEREGDLAEITAVKKQSRMEVGRAKTLEDLTRIAAERGYKRGWIFKQAQLKGIRK